MISAYDQNTMPIRLMWGVFSLDDLANWQAVIAESVGDWDNVMLSQYTPHILHVVQCICNGIDPAEYIDIHDVHWVNHMSSIAFIHKLVALVQTFVGPRQAVRIRAIVGSTDFYVERINGYLQ